MPATKFNLKGAYRIQQGSTFTIVLTCTSDDETFTLVGATAAAQVRETHDSTTATDFVCVVDSDESTITCTLSDTDTAAIDYEYGVWDCEVTFADSTVYRIIEGTVHITPEVTR